MTCEGCRYLDQKATCKRCLVCARNYADKHEEPPKPKPISKGAAMALAAVMSLPHLVALQMPKGGGVHEMTGPCETCGKWLPLEKHHVFGGSNRKRSEHYGFVVYLCHDHHNEPPDGVHHNAAKMLALHQRFQRIFELTHTRAQFMQEFGKSYILDD